MIKDLRKQIDVLNNILMDEDDPCQDLRAEFNQERLERLYKDLDTDGENPMPDEEFYSLREEVLRLKDECERGKRFLS
jgi:hypothetical protein